MKCGLADGLFTMPFWSASIKVGDVGLIKLLPRGSRQGLPLRPAGRQRPGQGRRLVLAMGNPFLLATDFNPTVTFGLVSRCPPLPVPGAATLLEYTDCIQIDTSINPGNSGGPLST